MEFKSGYRKYFDKHVPGEWVSTDYFRINLPAEQTLCVNDFAGTIRNSAIYSNITGLVTTPNEIDTIFDYRYVSLHNKFKYRSKVFTPVFYYDIVPTK